MAVILKNPDVHADDAKKLKYDDDKTEQILSNSIASDISEEEQTIESFIAEDSLNEVMQHEIEQEYKHFDGKIIHKDREYIIDHKVDEQVTSRLEQKISDLHEQKQKIFEDAEIEGYEAGINQAKQEFHDKQQTLDQLIENINNAFEKMVNEKNEYLQEVVFVAINRILGEKISDKENRINIIKTVIDSIATSNPFTLKLSKIDYESIQESNALNMIVNAEKIMSDNRVSIGGCIIETDKGIFDGRLEVQLARLKEVIDTKVDE